MELIKLKEFIVKLRPWRYLFLGFYNYRENYTTILIIYLYEGLQVILITSWLQSKLYQLTAYSISLTDSV